MIDQIKLDDALLQYKKSFVSYTWEKEKYKWEAVKHFQENWDVNAADFPEMLKRALSKTHNLLMSKNHYPAEMIQIFAEHAPEDVRAMFINLFDEHQDVISRIATFKQQSIELHAIYEEGFSNHYQSENAISTYLWLRYPDKYYIYKYGVIKKVAEYLTTDFKFKRGAYLDNLRNFYSFYDEMCNILSRDEELIMLFESQLTEDCYKDPKYKTLTIDVGYYISRNHIVSTNDSDESSSSKYDPNITVEEWVSLLKDPSIFTIESLQIMKRMKNSGGQATWTQLANTYGGNADFYFGESKTLVNRILKKRDSVLARETASENLTSVLYDYSVSDQVGSDEKSWRLKDDLSLALDQIDLSHIDINAHSEIESEKLSYWWLNANPKLWSFSGLAIGEEVAYTLYNENGNKRRIFQNFLDAKAGDIVIGYESSPVQKIVALGKIMREHDNQKLYFGKTENLLSPIEYKTIKNSPELQKMEYIRNPQGSLFKVSEDEYNYIMDLIREENLVLQEVDEDLYTKQDFLDEVFMDETHYHKLKAVLKNKKNVILQGAPGVGKTFAAKRLAYSILGKRDEKYIETVQFHQNYSYEDFVMGYKPDGNSFKLNEGIFYKFCQKAANQADKDFFFIIDEINRGNLSKIFGELLMLIERDYRGAKTTLAYTGKQFAVPSNVYIIGMMNTADRGLAMIDYALRRRFSFFNMEPGFHSDGFRKYKEQLNNDTFNKLIGVVQDLNRDIARDKSLGKGFCIGHSYFCEQKSCTDEWMESVVEFDIIPMVSEYWFDESEKLNHWTNQLRGVFQ